MITVDRLIEIGVAPTQAKAFAPYLAQHGPAFEISTARRAAAFLGQVMVESIRFTTLEENLLYTRPERLVQVWPSRFRNTAAAAPYVRNPRMLADFVYAGRNGNGDKLSGDGWRFRGRGLKQLTGRANYRAASVALGRPYVTSPDLVQEPDDAVRTACWFWEANGCNAMADAWNLPAITRKVNGPAMLHASSRARFSEQALAALTGRAAA